MKAFHLFLSTLLLSCLLLITPSFSDDSELCNPEDKKALLQIKKAFHNPYLLISWESDTDCCTQWNNAKCDEKTNRIISIGVNIDGDLSGQIPAAIGNLPYLTAISIRMQPNVTGPIPEAITNLKNLKYIFLSDNNLTGPVPSFLSKLQNLLYLDLSGNSLTGSIPSSLSKLPKLEYLRLDQNKLTGEIPTSLGLIKTKNFYLKLSHNQLSGKIPTTFKNVDFYAVYLSWNQLEGDVSMFFGAEKTALILDFSRNKFEFNMSTLQIYDSLNYLYVNHNKIYGSIPEAMTKLMYLQGFNVSYNNLCGKIPQGGSGRLQTRFDSTAYFHNKCLCGPPLSVTCK